MASYRYSRSGPPQVLGSTLVAVACVAAGVSAAIAANADTCDGQCDASDIRCSARTIPRSPTKTRGSFIQHQANMHPISLVKANREHGEQDGKVANDDVGDEIDFREAPDEVLNMSIGADDVQTTSSTTGSSATSSDTKDAGLPTEVRVKLNSPIVLTTTALPATDSINGSKNNSSSIANNTTTNTSVTNMTTNSSVSNMTTDRNKSNNCNDSNTTNAVACINNTSINNTSDESSSDLCVTQLNPTATSKWYPVSPPGTPCLFGVDVLDEGWHCITDDRYGEFGWCWTGKNTWGSCSEDCPMADDIMDDSTDATTTSLSQVATEIPRT